MLEYIRGFFNNYGLVLLLSASVAYLLGSVNFAIVFSAIARKRDIRKYGSGNAGATNMMRTFGAGLGVLTFICDLLKGACAVWLSILLADALVPHGQDTVLFGYLSGLFCVIGHLRPIYFSFKGGKGVSTALGTLLFLDWGLALTCLAVFIITVAIWRMVSLGSVVAVGVAPVLAFLFNYYINELGLYVSLSTAVVMLVLVSLIVAGHSQNIKRIVKGTESKLSFKKKKPAKAPSNNAVSKGETN